ncbi:MULTISPECIES: coiled-coil domain-containing protein [Cysteiniphilum]|uniref:Uncharacterized protein n=1 Tax=Cysteiniphilum litorale TaxID=2056700 RepID=A0A8J2Z2Y9_9GAMM|nr:MULTISPECIES: hypothetical protein [Cysteiniphilum]GGF91721.1 hypothetical protein GCM10010995_06150 [Cysteiniphilum litorale]
MDNLEKKYKTDSKVIKSLQDYIKPKESVDDEVINKAAEKAESNQPVFEKVHPFGESDHNSIDDIKTNKAGNNDIIENSDALYEELLKGFAYDDSNQKSYLTEDRSISPTSVPNDKLSDNNKTLDGNYLDGIDDIEIECLDDDSSASSEKLNIADSNNNVGSDAKSPTLEKDETTVSNEPISDLKQETINNHREYNVTKASKENNEDQIDNSNGLDKNEDVPDSDNQIHRDAPTKKNKRKLRWILILICFLCVVTIILSIYLSFNNSSGVSKASLELKTLDTKISQKNTELNSKVSQQIKDMTDKSNQQMTKLQGTLSLINEQISNLQDQYNQIKGDISTLKQKIEGNESQINKNKNIIDSQIKAFESLDSKFNSTSANYLNSLQDITSMIKSSDSKIYVLTNSNQQLNDSINRIDQQLEKLTHQRYKDANFYILGELQGKLLVKSDDIGFIQVSLENMPYLTINHIKYRVIEKNETYWTMQSSDGVNYRVSIKK